MTSLLPPPSLPHPSTISTELGHLVAHIGASTSYAHSKQLIDYLNEHANEIHRADLYNKYGSILLRDHRSALGDSQYDLAERTAIAAMEVGQWSTAEYCIKLLIARFGDASKSTRVGRLMGMQYEVNNDLQPAIDLYQQILEKDPTNTWCIKRIATLLQHSGNTDNLQQASKQLVVYLQKFSLDEPAYQQLLQLYLQAKQYDLAKFVAEELILIAPESYLYHTVYADIMYTKKDYEVARAHYSQAVELYPNCVRALYGILLSVRAQAVEQSQVPTSDTALELFKLAISRLTRIYQSNGSSVALKVLQQSFGGQALVK